MAAVLSKGIHLTPLESALESKVPRCLGKVAAVVVDLPVSRECTARAYALSSRSTGEDVAQVLGYPLGDYNSAFKDAADFISPISLQWMDGTESPLFDSDIHGYHGEMESSAKLRGQGDPIPFLCSQCGHNHFRTTVQFDYWDACEDLLEDEPDLPVEDYFCNVTLIGECVKCTLHNCILDMDV